MAIRKFIEDTTMNKIINTTLLVGILTSSVYANDFCETAGKALKDNQLKLNLTALREYPCTDNIQTTRWMNGTRISADKKTMQKECTLTVNCNLMKNFESMVLDVSNISCDDYNENENVLRNAVNFNFGPAVKVTHLQENKNYCAYKSDIQKISENANVEYFANSEYKKSILISCEGRWGPDFGGLEFKNFIYQFSKKDKNGKSTPVFEVIPKKEEPAKVGVSASKLSQDVSILLDMSGGLKTVDPAIYNAKYPYCVAEVSRRMSEFKKIILTGSDPIPAKKDEYGYIIDPGNPNPHKGLSDTSYYDHEKTIKSIVKYYNTMKNNMDKYKVDKFTSDETLKKLIDSKSVPDPKFYLNCTNSISDSSLGPQTYTNLKTMQPEVITTKKVYKMASSKDSRELQICEKMNLQSGGYEVFLCDGDGNPITDSELIRFRDSYVTQSLFAANMDECATGTADLAKNGIKDTVAEAQLKKIWSDNIFKEGKKNSPLVIKLK